jgi:hypothetical protein
MHGDGPYSSVVKLVESDVEMGSIVNPKAMDMVDEEIRTFDRASLWLLS